MIVSLFILSNSICLLVSKLNGSIYWIICIYEVLQLKDMKYHMP